MPVSLIISHYLSFHGQFEPSMIDRCRAARRFRTSGRGVELKDFLGFPPMSHSGSSRQLVESTRECWPFGVVGLVGFVGLRDALHRLPRHQPGRSGVS